MKLEKLENTTQLGYRERDKLYQKEYSALKIKIALNCFELFAMCVVLSIGFYLLATTLFEWTDPFPPTAISIVLGLILTGVFFKVKNYQVYISRFDKEDIYKKISKDLLKEKS